MSAHAPGPWSYEKQPVESLGYTIFAPDPSRPGAEIIVADRVPTEADARLIAAAPELLAAMIDMLAGWRYIRQFHGDLYGVGWDRAQEKAEIAAFQATGPA